MSPWRLKRLAQAFGRGAVIACATDTIWGFSCHPLAPAGVSKILSIKHRSWRKGLILLSSDLGYCAAYISDRLTQQQLDRISEPAAQPVTWLVPASNACPFWIKGDFSTVAVRITQHPLVRCICDEIRSPIVSTSANRAGQSPVRNSIQAQRQFANEVDYIVDGFCPGTKKPSEIKLIDSGAIIRTSS